MKLQEQEVRYLEEYTSKGVKDVRMVKRALVFLYLHQGLSQQQAAQKAGVCSATVANLIRRYKDVGQELIRALADAPRPGRAPKLVSSLQAHITALACSAAPTGYGKWTLRLLRDQVVELGYAPGGISHEAVRQCLKKANSSPGRAGNGA